MNEDGIVTLESPPPLPKCFKARYSPRTDRDWERLELLDYFDFEVGHSGKRFLNKEKTTEDERFIKRCNFYVPYDPNVIHQLDGLCIKEPNFERKRGLFNFDEIEFAKPGDCTP